MRCTNYGGGGHDVTAHAQHERPSGSGGVVGVSNESCRQTGEAVTDGECA